MRIEDVTERDGRKIFTVSFAERSLDDIRALDDGFADERPFAAVARASEVQAQVYDAVLRPWVKAAVTPTGAEISRVLHPKRVERALASSRNPVMTKVARAAETVRENRRKAAPDNPFLAAEQLWADSVEQAIDLYRDTRDMLYELTFYSLWSTPWARVFGRTHEARRTLKNNDELRGLPEVASALCNIDRGRLCRGGDPHAGHAGRQPQGRAPRPAGAVLARADPGRAVPFAGGRTARPYHPRTDPDRHL
jgi:hypothetical protein